MSKKTVDNKKDIEKLKEKAEKLYKAPNTSVDFGTGAVNVTTATSDGVSTPTPVTQYGWVCPVCGRVNAPWVSSCPCRNHFSIGWPGPNPGPFYPGDRPIDPNKPYEWGDVPPYTSPFTCGPNGGGLGKPIPCGLKQEGTGSYVDLNINTSISNKKNSNITAHNGKGVN